MTCSSIAVSPVRATRQRAPRKQPLSGTVHRARGVSVIGVLGPSYELS